MPKSAPPPLESNNEKVSELGVVAEQPDASPLQTKSPTDKDLPTDLSTNQDASALEAKTSEEKELAVPAGSGNNSDLPTKQSKCCRKRKPKTEPAVIIPTKVPPPPTQAELFSTDTSM
jgi:hypothetical protein